MICSLKSSDHSALIIRRSQISRAPVTSHVQSAKSAAGLPAFLMIQDFLDLFIFRDQETLLLLNKYRGINNAF